MPPRHPTLAAPPLPVIAERGGPMKVLRRYRHRPRAPAMFVQQCLSAMFVNCQRVHHRILPLAMGSGARVGFRIGAARCQGTPGRSDHLKVAGARLAGLPFLEMRP